MSEIERHLEQISCDVATALAACREGDVNALNIALDEMRMAIEAIELRLDAGERP